MGFSPPEAPRSLEQYHDLYRLSVSDPRRFWAQKANEFLSWSEPWRETFAFDFARGDITWFAGGKLNVAYNCVDRHAELTPDAPAIVWESNEPGEGRVFSFRQLQEEVCRAANMLSGLGVRPGDRIAVYLPMVPELAITMLACARIGAIHSVIFAGFSPESVRDRILDAQCSTVVTADEGVRGSKHIPLKEMTDAAIDGVECVKRVLVVRRTGAAVIMKKGRDLFFHEQMARAASEAPAPAFDAENPLFILYTSGSTGKPKGVLHTSAGYLLHAAYTFRTIFDYRPGDLHFCAADCGWVTGHSYIVYGPLANGAATVMFESIPTYPDPGRYWETIQRLRPSTLYTAPTAIRALIKEGDSWVKRYNRSSVRVLGSVGEPINVDAWRWYHDVVGEGRTAVVDTWWQTETGGILISPIPGVTPVKPGSATLPFFGVRPSIVDESGAEVTGNGVRGRLCIDHSWPGQARTVYGDHDRFRSTYFGMYPGRYFTGDAVERDDDGYYWLRGRVDDVLLVSGHRIGTAEVESAIVQSGVVAEAAVVGMPHDIKGVGIYAFCIPLVGDGAGHEGAVREAVRKHLSPIATPDVVQFVPGLPKTRSGKIMRRILRKIAEGEREGFGDTTTLAEPAVVERIVEGADRLIQMNALR